MPIDLTQWPQTDDVQALLTASGLWPTDSGQQAAATTEIEAALGSAVVDFEQRTGWAPFLAANTDSTRYYAAADDRGLLSLDGGLVAITSLNVNGQAYTQNTDYWLRRSNAVAVHAPYEQIQFATCRAGALHSAAPDRIAITGRWGYTATLPANVWEGVRQGAAALTALNLATASQGVVRVVVEDHFRQSFDLGLRRSDRIQEWLNEYNALLVTYRRVIS